MATLNAHMLLHLLSKLDFLKNWSQTISERNMKYFKSEYLIYKKKLTFLKTKKGSHLLYFELLAISALSISIPNWNAVLFTVNFKLKNVGQLQVPQLNILIYTIVQCKLKKFLAFCMFFMELLLINYCCVMHLLILIFYFVFTNYCLNYLTENILFFIWKQ